MTEGSHPGAAIITGAARNIGRATAVALANLGFAVVVHAQGNREGAEETAQAVESAGSRAVVVLADLNEAGAADDLAAAARKLGRIAVLVNNAAVRRAVPFDEMSLDEWRAIMAVNLDAAFLCARACIADMVEGGWGRIVNIGGLTGHTGASGRAHVVTSKAALVGLTKALATEYAGTGVTANCVVPGEIETVRGGAAGARGHHPGKQPPMVGRRGEPREVAAVIAMLCGGDAGYITGQTIHVNGGAYLP
ncbi:MAG TPA: SDR family oxidoreductase [Alphaproteobacteria bacterium]|nr:SDR family oxidoreductase [Alphaproteobacteria bacterium]